MRISTTTLESYRLFSEQDWMREADLINSIKGIREETPQMALGTAFHAVLEDPPKYRTVLGYQYNGFQFPDATMQPCLDLIDRRGVFEVKATTEILGHTVVAKADQIVGLQVYEHKTTCSSFDVDKYLQSYQWRFELLIFDALSVTYRVFCLEEPREGIVGLKSIESPITVYPYANLHADCADLVRRFVEYVTARGLTAYLQPKHELAGAA